MDELYSRLLEFTRDAVVRYTFEDARILLANQGFLDMLELDGSVNDVVGRRVRDLLDYVEEEGRIRHQLKTHGEVHNLDYQFKTLKGNTRWVRHDARLTNDPLTGVPVVETIFRDRTFQVKAQRELESSRARYQSILDGMSDLVLITTPSYTVEYMNPAMEAFIGDRPKQLDEFKALLGLDREPDWYPWSDADASVEHEVMMPAEGRTFHAKYTPIPAPDGTSSLMLVMRDITALRTASEALQQSEAQLKSIIDLVPMMITARDGNGTFLLANHHAAEIYGFKREQLVGRTLRDAHPWGQEADRYLADDRHVIETQAPQVNEENTFRNTRGITKLLHTTRIPYQLPGSEEPAVLEISVDITERKAAENALLHQEHLETVRVMARGVAHTFSNITNVIRSAAYSIAEEMVPNSNAHRSSIRILDASKHAMDLTRQLVNVASENETGIEREPVLLLNILNESVDLLANILRERNIEVNIRGQDRLPCVLADRKGLGEAIMNVLLNALEAMRDGGTITIDTIERRILRPKANPQARGGLFVGLRIRDTGEGMSAETVDNLFKPFYTTKTEGHAFGLGLTITQSTLQQMGGWIDVRSRKGEGTTFRLFLSKAAPPAHVDTQESSTPRETSILIVDDCPVELLRAQRTLHAAGFTITTATTADEAIAILTRSPAAYGLIIVDLIMPTIESGAAVVQFIREQSSDTKVIVTSGFSRELARAHLPQSGWDYLQKPVPPDELLGAVHPLLPDSTPSARWGFGGDGTHGTPGGNRT